MFFRVLTLLAVSLSVQVPKLDESNFARWRDTIRPKRAEFAFEDCAWKPTFWEAVVEAQATGKPILLWAMNGHPLACT